MKRKLFTLSLLPLSLLMCLQSGKLASQRTNLTPPNTNGQTVPWLQRSPLTPSLNNWYSINTKLSEELARTDLGTLAQQELQAPPPKMAKEWLRRLALFVRADYPQQIQQMLRLRTPLLTPDAHWGIGDLVNQSAGYQNIALARRLCELFPEQTAPDTWFDKWANQEKPEIVDAWLAQRGMTGYELWFHQRLKFRAKFGTDDALMAPLAARIRANPDQWETIETYVRAAAATGKPHSIAWLAETVKPKLAVQTFVLATYLLPNQATIPLLERTLTLPLTPEDATWYHEYTQRVEDTAINPNLLFSQPLLHLRTKEKLLPLYQQTQQAAKVQQTLADITALEKSGAERPKYMPRGGFKPRLTPEQEMAEYLRQTPPDKKDTHEYLSVLGNYHSLRQEDKLAVEVFEKALSLAPRSAESSFNPHWLVIQSYARHLASRNPESPKEAYQLIRHELESAPLNSDLARHIVTTLADYDRKEKNRFILPTDELLWKFLAAQSDWHTQGQVLFPYFFRNAPDQRETIWKRAEALAKASPSFGRSHVLALLAVGLADYPRAAFWFENAQGQLLDKNQHGFDLTTRWQVYFHLKNWRKMEDLIPLFISSSYHRFWDDQAQRELAIVTAQSGEKQKAMRYFRQWANQDRRQFPAELSPQLAAAILPELRTYYRQLALKEPQSATPARVLKQIGSRE